MTVDGYCLRLEVQVWRDAQPGADMSLVITVQVVEEQGRTIPADLIVEQVALDYQSEQWKVKPAQATQRVPSHREVTARGRFTWPPGAMVNVMVWLRSAASSHVVQLEEVLIRKVE